MPSGGLRERFEQQLSITAYAHYCTLILGPKRINPHVCPNVLGIFVPSWGDEGLPQGGVAASDIASGRRLSEG